jgi:hypothetical protein
MIINNPNSQQKESVLTTIFIKMSADVVRWGITGWIAADVGLPFSLVHPYVLDGDLREELRR